MRGSAIHIGAWAVIALAAGCQFDPAGTGEGDPREQSADAGGLRPADAAAAEPDAGSDPGTLKSFRAARPPTLDGNAETTWLAAEPISFALTDAMKLVSVEEDYSWDGTVVFASLYDDDNIYFLFQVADSVLRDDSLLPYHDDAIELYLDAAGDGAGPYGDDDHWIAIQSTGVYQSFGPSGIDVTGSVETTDAGYLVEISIARADLGADGAAQLGFDVGMVDDDGLGADTAADAYGLWYVPDRPHCDDCCSEGPQAWCDTSMLGRLELVGEE
jgi:hypothetical protein